jgi:transcriptional regulator with PAS, ATPase and Fis domain
MPEFVLDDTARVTTGAQLKLLGVELTVVEGPSRGERVRIDGATATVGSGERNVLRIQDRSVSRMHAEITLREGAITLRDLESTNGTYIGEARVRDVDVAPGTVVRIGNSAFRIDSADEPAFLPLSSATRFGDLVGSSVAMRQVYSVLERVAPSETTVLVQGETGTGKDVAARAIHEASPRAKGPFVPVDCGAIPENLFESELFGHVRGAFTGAVQSRAGAFEEANHGTLFLDEIGEMPLSMQAKLLRAIESRRIRRVGETKEIDLDVRIVCATNRRLASMVNAGAFREDLFYRLAVVEVVLPPLRARKEDIPVIAQHLYAKMMASRGLPVGVLSSELIERLVSRGFPGNVRELRNVIERAITLGHAEGSRMPSPLPAGLESIVPTHLPLKDARDAWTNEFETIYVRAMMQKTSGNVTRAAELAGVSRRFLQRMIVRLGLREELKVDPEDG